MTRYRMAIALASALCLLALGACNKDTSADDKAKAEAKVAKEEAAAKLAASKKLTAKLAASKKLADEKLAAAKKTADEALAAKKKLEADAAAKKKALDGVAAKKKAEADAATKKKTDADTAAKAKSDAEAKATADANSPAGLIGAYKTSLLALSKCELSSSRSWIKDKECRKPFEEAGKKFGWKSLKTLFPEEKARKAVETAHKKARTELLLTQENETVLLYLFKGSSFNFERNEKTVARSEALMSHANKSLADYAGYFRFHKFDKADAATLTLAKTVLAAHKHVGIRTQGCSYMKNSGFKGDDAIYKELMKYTNAKVAESVLKCALGGIGRIGGVKAIATLKKHMGNTNLQSTVVSALAELKDKKAYNVYLDYYVKNLKNPKSVKWTAVGSIVPWLPRSLKHAKKSGWYVDSFPVKKAIKVLKGIVLNSKMDDWSRTKAIDELAELEEKALLESLKKKIAADKEDEKGPKVVKAIDKALKTVEKRLNYK